MPKDRMGRKWGGVRSKEENEEAGRKWGGVRSKEENGEAGRLQRWNGNYE